MESVGGVGSDTSSFEFALSLQQPAQGSEKHGDLVTLTPLQPGGQPPPDGMGTLAVSLGFPNYDSMAAADPGAAQMMDNIGNFNITMQLQKSGVSGDQMIQMQLDICDPSNPTVPIIMSLVTINQQALQKGDFGCFTIDMNTQVNVPGGGSMDVDVQMTIDPKKAAFHSFQKAMEKYGPPLPSSKDQCDQLFKQYIQNPDSLPTDVKDSLDQLAGQFLPPDFRDSIPSDIDPAKQTIDDIDTTTDDDSDDTVDGSGSQTPAGAADAGAGSGASGAGAAGGASGGMHAQHTTSRKVVTDDNPPPADPSAPSAPAGGASSASVHSSSFNPFFSASPFVAFQIAFTTMTMMLMEMKSVEGIIQNTALSITWSIAKDTSSAIQSQAEFQCEQYMADMICQAVGLATTCVSAAVMIGAGASTMGASFDEDIVVPHEIEPTSEITPQSMPTESTTGKLNADGDPVNAEGHSAEQVEFDAEQTKPIEQRIRDNNTQIEHNNDDIEKAQTDAAKAKVEYREKGGSKANYKAARAKADGEIKAAQTDNQRLAKLNKENVAQVKAIREGAPMTRAQLKAIADGPPPATPDPKNPNTPEESAAKVTAKYNAQLDSIQDKGGLDAAGEPKISRAQATEQYAKEQNTQIEPKRAEITEKNESMRTDNRRRSTDNSEIRSKNREIAHKKMSRISDWTQRAGILGQMGTHATSLASDIVKKNTEMAIAMERMIQEMLSTLKSILQTLSSTFGDAFKSNSDLIGQTIQILSTLFDKNTDMISNALRTK